MKGYLSLFRIRVQSGLQYRIAAAAGIATQFAWGALRILFFKALYETNPAALPMELPALCSYIWMQQACLAMFASWTVDKDLLDMISSGSVAYQLCRPMDLYTNWFIQSFSNRLSRMLLRCLPILLVAAFLPYPYGLLLPKSPLSFLLFLISAPLGGVTVVSLTMIVYGITFFTLDSRGFRTVIFTAADFLTGSLLPLPFFPEKIRPLVQLLPFASIQDAPLRIYTGDIAGMAALQTLALQLFWAIVMVLGGRLLMARALRNVVVQGG